MVHHHAIIHPVCITKKSKAQASILCQLRTGIARQNGYLSKINAVESGNVFIAIWELQGYTTFLFYCPFVGAFQSEHQGILATGTKDGMGGHVLFLVGGWSGPSKDGEKRDLEGSFNTKAVLGYILLTMRFSTQVASTTGKMR